MDQEQIKTIRLTDNIEKLHLAMNDSIQVFNKTLYECREEILVAFMAKYGLQPDECEQVIQGNIWYVRRKEK